MPCTEHVIRFFGSISAILFAIVAANFTAVINVSIFASPIEMGHSVQLNIIK